jgi:polar amino acid transport system permease protein
VVDLVTAESATPDLFASRRRQLLHGRHSTLLSALSTVIVIGVVAAVAFWAPGGVTFRHFFFNPHQMWIALTGNTHGLASVGKGIVTNIWMFCLCEVLVLVLALGLAWVRISTAPVLAPLRVLATIYTDVFRGIPILLVFIIVGFGFSELNIGWISHQSPAFYGCTALTITYTAYVAEVYRAGLHSVPQGQILAARSLGLSQAATMRRVILPQAVRTVIPPLLNDFISMQKDTALVSILGIVEAVQSAQIDAAQNFNDSGLVVAALLFLVMTVPLTRFTDHLIEKDRHRRLAVGQ